MSGFLYFLYRLWGCSITPFSCQYLASALVSSQSLETLDLGQNTWGQSGIMVLLKALKQNHGSLKTLRLKMDKSTVEIQRLLKDVKENNPRLTIECNDTRTTRSSCCDFFSWTRWDISLMCPQRGWPNISKTSRSWRPECHMSISGSECRTEHWVFTLWFLGISTQVTYPLDVKMCSLTRIIKGKALCLMLYLFTHPTAYLE